MRLTITILAALSLGVTLAGADFTGTWKVNMEKSNLQGRDITNETMTISQTGVNTYSSAFDYVTQSGEKHHQEFNRIYDGKEHPLAGVAVKPDGITEICEQVDASTRKITRKRNGKATLVLTSTVSPDGKTITNTTTNSGTGTKEVLVFDKQ